MVVRVEKLRLVHVGLTDWSDNSPIAVAMQVRVQDDRREKGYYAKGFITKRTNSRTKNNYTMITMTSQAIRERRVSKFMVFRSGIKL
ncbi:UNVERIFIED_CONTAM: hypothetical protein Sradi_5311400 [Sesamum radiatum]|uniref:Uncharacterized protein n=1 Tax=Sesamum radiatum TaxID=300843 RepID=A0AAW2LPR1_SESRA